MDVMTRSLHLPSLWVHHSVPLETTVPGPPQANDHQLTTPSLRSTLRKPCHRDIYFLQAVLWFDAFPTQSFLPSLLSGVLDLHCTVNALHLLPLALLHPSQAVSHLAHQSPSVLVSVLRRPGRISDPFSLVHWAWTKSMSCSF